MKDLLKFRKALSCAVLSSTGRTILVLVVAIGGCSLSFRHHMAQATPPLSVTTIEEFWEIMDNSEYGWGRFRKNTESYYEARKLMPLHLMTSGSACYVFDDTGQFVEWTFDNGDDRDWDRKWGQGGRVEMSFEQIQAEIEVRTAQEQ